MGTLLAILAIVGMFVVGLLGSALWYRPRKGRFRVRQSNPRCFTFESDYGEFTIDAGGQTLIHIGKKKVGKFALADIQRLAYRYREEEAVLAEIARGWDIWDMSKKYRDVTGWFEISAVLADDTRIPLYAIGQYDPKEMWCGWWFAFERGLLAKLGLFTSAEDRSRAVLKELQGAFAEAGRRLSLL